MKNDERNFRRRLHGALSETPGALGAPVENTAASGWPDLHYLHGPHYTMFELKVCDRLSTTGQSVKFTRAQNKFWTLAERKNLRAWVVIQIGVGPTYLYTVLPKSSLDDVRGRGLRYYAVCFGELADRCRRALLDPQFNPSFEVGVA